MTSELTRPGSYDELGTHRHLLISERLRLRRRVLGLTQKEVVSRLRRIGVATTNKAVSSLEHGTAGQYTISVKCHALGEHLVGVTLRDQPIMQYNNGCVLCCGIVVKVLCV